MVKHNESQKNERGRTISLIKPQSLLQLMDLNDDCLTKIFDSLDILSLLKVCKVGQRFKDIVIQRVIPLKTVDFSTFSQQKSTQKIFKVFGKSMTRIKIHSDDIQIYPKHSRFEEFLRLVTVYGVPGKLRQVCLTFGKHETSISIQLLMAAAPFFENVHTLRFNATTDQAVMPSRVTFFNEFMILMPKQNLRVLFLNDVRWLGDWMRVESLPKLQALHICLQFDPFTAINRAQIESAVLNYISEKPALTSFEYVGLTSDAVFVEISRSIPHMEKLGRIQTWSNLRNNTDTDMDRRQSNRDRGKFNYLNSLSNLRSFSLKSGTLDFSDCSEIFRILGTRNTIENLKLIPGWGAIDGSSPIGNADLNRMTKLKALHLIDFCQPTSLEFLNNLFANLPELTECTFSGSRIKQALIVRLLEVARKLRVLEFDGKITAFSSTFYKKLLKIREAASTANPLVIFIDGATVNSCKTELGNKYKHSIIALKSS